MNKPLVSVRGLRKSFAGGDSTNLVLKDVDLDIGPGALLVIRGVSGSGKTTLLNIIGGIDSPDAGTVCVAGRALESLDFAQRTRFRAETVGYIFQFHNLISTLTVEENVLSGLEAMRPLRREDWQRAGALLERVGLAGYEKRFPARLSGGQQQRVAIARALIKQPALILADEPTGSLDEATGEAVIDLLAEVQREHSTTIVLVTHNPALCTHANRVLEIRSGYLRDYS